MIDINTTPIASLLEAYTWADMQMYVYVMVAFVVIMTILDLLHKGSAIYFFDAAAKADADLAAGDADCSLGKEDGRLKQLSSGDKMGILVNTVAVDVATAGEFSNPTRRVVHILTMWGFILFNAATAIIIFGEVTDNELLAQVWNVGAIMLLVGSFWYWFSMRVNAIAEGDSWMSIEWKRDMFSLALMGLSFSALGWEIYGGGAGVWFGLVLLSSTVLFCGVYWSKFSHMFFKPMAAYNKRILQANGTNENLPHETRDDEWQQNRHSMELLKDAPMDMGLGIKREAPNHY
ncbi:Adenylylsulfate reductase membrane anchor [uncultured Candidatus Thioglobus sp.]|nr:Adenylylsulfate reductase membrane anchor [uncultured Candidatus Thioglobus sp.]